ncbi:MAG: methyltransferase domain-containing protein [Deltaproteobacteria bacterium]|nr:methyltransferase domain-containing protein [Deltaproteobacteria bacterium]
MDCKEVDILGEKVWTHWYYRAKAAAAARLLAARAPRLILDVGAGSGYFAKYLLKHTDAAAAICVDPAYAGDRDEAFAGKSVQFRLSAPVEPQADCLLFMDVLEHVDDDIQLLREYVARAPAGARVLITVPAFRWLWSGHDIFLGHRRRYTLSGLSQAVRAAGLVIEQGSYFFAGILPAVALLRWWRRHSTPRSDLTLSSAAVNGLLYRFCAAELPFFRVNRLAGLTVFCLAVKP